MLGPAPVASTRAHEPDGIIRHDHSWPNYRLDGRAPEKWRRLRAPMEALLVSTGVVALAEIGDKTQLLTLLLATRYRAPAPIVLGIFVATLLNHALASAVGAWLVHVIGP